jgi:hypothetical protein
METAQNSTPTARMVCHSCNGRGIEGSAPDCKLCGWCHSTGEASYPTPLADQAPLGLAIRYGPVHPGSTCEWCDASEAAHRGSKLLACEECDAPISCEEAEDRNRRLCDSCFEAECRRESYSDPSCPGCGRQRGNHAHCADL